MDCNPGRVPFLLLYASQTGNAKAIAEDIAEKCETERFTCTLSCVSEIGKQYSLDKVLSIVLVGSTTGDGDPPDTARKFWRQLKKKGQSSDALAHLSYTILGLGDTNYTNFCNFGKTVDQQLQSLGAQRFYDCGWADDGTGLEVVIEPWLEGLLPALRKHLKCVNPSDPIPVNGELINGVGKGSNQVPLVDKDVKDVVNGDIALSDKKIIMENFVNDTSDDANRTSNRKDPYTVATEYNLSLLSIDRLSGLSIKQCVFESDAKLSVPVLPPSYLVLSYLEDAAQIVEFQPPVTSAATGITKLKLKSVRRLTKGEAVKTTMEATLESFEGENLFNYQPGDAIGIIVKNPLAEVELVFSLLGISSVVDRTYKLSVDENTKKKTASIPNFIPCVSTIRYVFENCIDIRSVPKKTFLRTLIEYTADPDEQRRLKELVSKEGSKEYSDHVRGSNLTFIDLLVIFHSCKPPVSVLLENLPQLQPRFYSAVSSPLVDPNMISFAFNIVEFQQSLSVTFPRNGICTGWLSSYSNRFDKLEEHMNEDLRNLTLEDSKEDVIVRTYLKSNQNFRLPKDNSVPVIMVGPGTGVAPFIGFLKHRQLLISSDGKDTLGESWLFFGCRHRKRDYLYQEKLEQFEKQSILNHLVLCFSRHENEGSAPKYVQDNIRMHGSQLVSLLTEKGAIVYVCGDAKNMAKDVFEAFVSVLEVNQGWSMLEARKYLAQMQIEKRYLQDVWA